MKLSEKILYSRKRAGLSQEALADMVGVSRQAVSKWETGEALPETAKLAALGTALGVSLDWLLSDAEPEEPEEEPAAFVAAAGRRIRLTAAMREQYQAHVAAERAEAARKDEAARTLARLRALAGF